MQTFGFTQKRTRSICAMTSRDRPCRGSIWPDFGGGWPEMSADALSWPPADAGFELLGRFSPEDAPSSVIRIRLCAPLPLPGNESGEFNEQWPDRAGASL